MWDVYCPGMGKNRCCFEWASHGGMLCKRYGWDGSQGGVVIEEREGVGDGKSTFSHLLPQRAEEARERCHHPHAEKLVR